MGGSAICGGLLSLLLPETLGALLPETLEDIGNLRNNDKGFFQCWSNATLKARMEKLADASKQQNSEKGQSGNKQKGKF